MAAGARRIVSTCAFINPLTHLPLSGSPHLALPSPFPYLLLIWHLHMAYWLMKTEPSAYSYEDLKREGKATWDGVKNNQALIYLRAMKAGDQALIYHSGSEKRIVGLAEITRGPYPDPRMGNPKLVVVDLEPRRALPHGAPLSQIRALKEFSGFALIRNSRLSVMPVSAAQWKELIAMSH